MAKEISQAKFLKVFAKTNGRCFYCNKFAEEIDHFVPKAWMLREGGFSTEDINGVENLVPACKHCNVVKNDKHPEEYMGYHECWSRYHRVNKRIGIAVSEYGHWLLTPDSPWVGFWHFNQKYGT